MVQLWISQGTFAELEAASMSMQKCRDNARRDEAGSVMLE